MQRIGFVVFPDFQVMGFAALTAFEIANVISGQAYYRIQLLSEHGGPIRASAGFTVETTAIGRKSFDTVVIGAGMEPYPASAGILDFVRRSVRTARRVAALHRRLHAGRGRRAGWPPGHHALGLCARAASPLSPVEGRRRSHLHHRRPRVDVGRDERRH